MGEPDRINDALRRTTGRLTHSRDLRRFLGEVLHEALRLLGAGRGHIFTYEPQDGSFTYAAGSGSEQYYLEPEPDEPDRFRRPFPAATFPVFAWMIRNRRAAVFTRDAADAPPPPDLIDWFERNGFRDAVCLPLLAGNDPVGFIGLLFGEASHLSREQLEFFEAIGNHAALAVRMARLAEQAEAAAVAVERERATVARQAAVTEERTRLARDLHDSLAQGFAGISVLLESAKRIVRNNPEKAAGCIADALSLARVGLTEVRRAVWALRPSDLDGVDLGEAVTRFIDRIRREAKPTIELRLTGRPTRRNPQDEGELFRIVQEAVTNSLRHAEAGAVTVSLRWGEDSIEIVVADDGRGFNPTQPAEGFGFVSMRERAARIGATIDFVSAPGAGTGVHITLSGHEQRGSHE